VPPTSRPKLLRSLPSLAAACFLVAFAAGSPLPEQRSAPSKPGTAQTQLKSSKRPHPKPTPKSSERPPTEKPDVIAAWKVLHAGVAEPKLAKRMETILALGTIGASDEARRMVESRLADSAPQMRQAAAMTLGKMKSQKSAPALRLAMKDKAPEVSFAAALALWELGDHSGRHILYEVLAGKRGTSPGMVRGQMQDAKAKLDNPSGLAMMGARHGAGALLGPFALGLPLAEGLWKDGSAPTRALAARLLGEDNGSQSIELLERALGDKNWLVRAAAAQALGDLSSQRSVPKLRVLLEDKKPGARYMAAASIIRLKIPQTGREAASLASSR